MPLQAQHLGQVQEALPITVGKVELLLDRLHPMLRMVQGTTVLHRRLQVSVQDHRAFHLHNRYALCYNLFRFMINLSNLRMF